MKKNRRSGDTTPRQILGFSLTHELARRVKSEAERRDITLRQLFEELWDLDVNRESSR
jgi:hypothetical protein